MIIALNNKCNLSKEQFIEYNKQLNTISTSHKLILCPSFLNVPLFDSQSVKLGAQNVSRTNEGAYTGEVSATQLKSFKVEYCIVGHSERRQYQKEDNNQISEKISKLLENDIIPILCIGEAKEEYDNNETKNVLKEEIESALGNIASDKISKVIIAYEPIWSIGTGIIPTIEEIDNVLEFLKEILPENKMLYGGSANENNIDILNNSKYIDGYLLGGLSLKPDKLKVFIDKINK